MKCVGQFAIPFLFVLANVAHSAEVATVSFDAGEQATYPNAIKAGQDIEVDLAALSKGTAVYRAILRPGRNASEARQRRMQPVKITVADSGAALPLMPPRFNAFDVTEAVRKAIKSGQGKIVFNVESFPGYQSGQTR